MFLFPSSHAVSTVNTMPPREYQPTHQLFRAGEQESSNQSSWTDWLLDLSSKTLAS